MKDTVKRGAKCLLIVYFSISNRNIGGAQLETVCHRLTNILQVKTSIQILNKSCNGFSSYILRMLNVLLQKVPETQ